MINYQRICYTIIVKSFTLYKKMYKQPIAIDVKCVYNVIHIFN